MSPHPGLLIAAARRRIKRTVLDRIGPWGLTAQQFWMLVAIGEHPGISQVEIAARTRAEPPDVSRALAALVGRGLVRTAPDPDDRRRTLVWLTRAGTRLVKELAPVARSIRDSMLAGMTRDEIAALTAALQRILENLDALDERRATREPA